jgi:hypothetical protein
MSSGSIDWRTKPAVFADKIVLRDPTGTAAQASNGNPDLLCYEEIPQLFQAIYSSLIWFLLVTVAWLVCAVSS